MILLPCHIPVEFPWLFLNTFDKIDNVANVGSHGVAFRFDINHDTALRTQFPSSL